MNDKVAYIHGVTFRARRPDDGRPDAPAYALNIHDGRGGSVFLSLLEIEHLRRFITSNFPESE